MATDYHSSCPEIHFGHCSTEKKSVKVLVNLVKIRVSVQGVKSLVVAILHVSICREFDFYEVKKKSVLLLFFEKKREILL